MYRFIIRGTVESRMYSLLQSKPTGCVRLVQVTSSLQRTLGKITPPHIWLKILSQAMNIFEICCHLPNKVSCEFDTVSFRSLVNCTLVRKQ